MKTLQKFGILFFGLQIMMLQGQESKVPENQIQCFQEISMLKNLSGIQFFIEINNIIESNKQLDSQQFKGLLDIVTTYQHLFVDIINNDIYLHDRKFKDGQHVEPVIRKGELLTKSVRANTIQIVRLLLAAGANVDAIGLNKWTALIWACTKNNDEMVELLLDAGAIYDIQSLESGFTALSTASDLGNVKIVQLLLNHGASTRIPESIYQRTPLMIASCRNYLEIAQLLIDNHADTTLVDLGGNTAEYLAKTPEMQSVFVQAKIKAQRSSGSGLIS